MMSDHGLTLGHVLLVETGRQSEAPETKINENEGKSARRPEEILVIRRLAGYFNLQS